MDNDTVLPPNPETFTPTPPPPRQTTTLTIILIIIVGLLFLLFGVYLFMLTRIPGSTNQVEPTTESIGPNVQQIKEAEVLIIGTDATFPPMEYINEAGHIIGYDIDLGNHIAQELGVAPQFVNYAWDDLFTALQDGTIDVIISSVTITDERQQVYDFSEPYLNAGQVIITLEDNHTITGTHDLSGKRIAVQEGTTNQEQAQLYTQPEYVVAYSDFMEATNALLNGEADAIFSDLTGAKGIIEAHPELKIASDPFTSEFYGVVFRKDEPDLVEKFNRIIISLRQRGILLSLKQKWLE